MLARNGEMRGKVARYAGTAGTVAPIVRRLARDEELRNDFKVVVEAARKLYGDLSSEEPLSATRKIFTDNDVRRQIDKALAAIEDASSHVRHARKRSRARVGWLVAGTIVGGTVVLFFVPKTAPTMRRWAGNVTSMAGRQSGGSADIGAPLAA